MVQQVPVGKKKSGQYRSCAMIQWTCEWQLKNHTPNGDLHNFPWFKPNITIFDLFVYIHWIDLDYPVFFFFFFFFFIQRVFFLLL